MHELELEREAGLRDRGGGVSLEPGELRSDHRDLCRNRDRRRRRVIATAGGSPLCVGQPLCYSIGLTGEDKRPGVPSAELGVAADDLWRQGREPSAHRAQLACVHVPE